MLSKIRIRVASFRIRNKLSLFLFLIFLISGILCLGAPAAPVSAATLESLPVGTYINFGGKIWQKFDYYSGTNGMTLDNSAQTYLLQYNPNYQTAFDGRVNTCNSNQGYGWNDFNSSQLKNYLNDTTENGFLGSLSNNSWVINKTDWSTVDQETGYVGNRPNNSNASCSTTGGTGATTVSTKVALPSYQEWTNKNVNIANTVNGMSYWRTRTPHTSYASGLNVRVVMSSGVFNIGFANGAGGVRPTLHLKSNIQVSTGDGTVSSPYCLSDGVTDSCMPATDTNPTDCSGANASKLACQVPGTYFNFGGKIWQKAKFYNNTTVDNTAQTYLIMNRAVNTGMFDNQQNLCAAQPYGYNDFSSANTIYNNLNTTFYDSLPTEKLWIQSKTWSTTDDLLQNNKPKISSSPCTYQFDGTGAITATNTKIGLMSAIEWNNRYYKSGLALANPNTTSWTRTPYSYSSSGDNVRVVSPTGAFDNYSASSTFGVRPALHLASNIQVSGGAGTLGLPYCLTDGSVTTAGCNIAPVISISSPATGAFLSTLAGYNQIAVAGTVSDAENTNQTIYYQFDSLGWNALSPQVTGLSGGAAKAFNYSISVSALNAGAHTLQVRSYDGALYSSIISRTFSIDNVAPTLTITNSGTSWQNIVKSGTVSVSDAGAGVNRVTYTFAASQIAADTTFGANCAGGTLTNNGASISAPAGGANLFLCAMDNVGNISKASGVYNWENTKPVCTGWNPSTTNWVNTLIGTTFTPTGCSDSGGSGLVTPVPSCLTAATNNATCNVTVADNASNQETHISPAVKIDTLPPTISANGASTPWQNSVLNATVSIADQAAAGANGQSGIARANYIWNTDNTLTPSSILGAACTNGTAVTNGTTLGSAAGGTTLYLCSIDNAGNVTFNQGRYNWENSPPTITQTPSFVADGANNIYLNNPTITITGSDIGGSQIDGIRFQWDTSFLFNAPATGQLAWQANNQSTNIPAAGSHYLYYQARDNAGNLSNVESVLYKFDSTPTTQILITDAGVSGNNGWFTTAPTATVYGRDVTNEVDTNENITDLYINFKSGEYDDSFTPITNYPLTSNDANHKYVANITPPTDSISNPTGIITLYYMSKNIAGTYSVVGHTTFKIDTGKPTGLLSVPIHSGGQNPLIFSFTASDSPSGLDVCNLQMSTVSIPTDLVLQGGGQGNSSILESDWSSWSTISNDCNGNYTQILDTDTGYRFQMNLLDLAGNTNQVKMNESVLDMIGLPVVFNRTPHLKVNNTDSNGNSIMGMMRYSPEAELGGTNTSDGTPIPQHTSFNISGTVSDSDPDQTLIVTATIAGVTKSQTISPKGANKGFLDNGFNLSWNGLEIATQLGGGDPLLSIPSLPATFSAIPVTVTDGQNMAEVNHNEGVTLFRNHLVIPRNDETRRIYNEALSKYTGTIYFPTASTPSIKTKSTGLIVPNSSNRPQTNSWYCYDTTGCQILNDEPLDSQKSIQIWYKTIAGKEYPYQVRFYEMGSASFGSENRVSESGW